MDTLEKPFKNTFINHVFKFDEDTKSELCNIIQYTILSLVPVVALNKTLQKFVPEADEEKGNLEILVEIIFQVIIMFVGLFFVHRLVTYVPTYSETKYPEYNVLGIVLAVLMIVSSLQTKLGEKVSIISDRVIEVWDGRVEKNNEKPPQQIQATQQPMPPQSMPPQTTSISNLPQQQSLDFDNMYRNDQTPLVNANVPGYGQNDIMAANEAGSSFGNF
jgi:hypothetical protein